MNLLLVNNQFQLGGAETVVGQLRRGFPGSRLMVATGKTYPPDVESMYPRLLSRLYHTRMHNAVARLFPQAGWTDRRFQRLARDPADIIHLHNFHGNYASIASLAHVAARKKLVWTFHALWGITGGCDHPRACKRYQEKCGDCPQVGWWPVGPVDHTAAQLEEKKLLLSTAPIRVIAPSRWLEAIVRESQIGQRWQITHIPNGIDPEKFGPSPRRDSGSTTILVVNRNFTDEQKGHRMVQQALSVIDPNGVKLILAGQNSAAAASQLPPGFKCLDAGYIHDRSELAALYAMADIFLFASPAENFPCVILEAMASECCVVATPTGGVVEQIEDGQSGFLARSISGDSLGLALQDALADRSVCAEMGRAARRRVIGHFTESRMIGEHLKLYRAMLDEN